MTRGVQGGAYAAGVRRELLGAAERLDCLQAVLVHTPPGPRGRPGRDLHRLDDARAAARRQSTRRLFAARRGLVGARRRGQARAAPHLRRGRRGAAAVGAAAPPARRICCGSGGQAGPSGQGAGAGLRAGGEGSAPEASQGSSLATLRRHSALSMRASSRSIWVWSAATAIPQQPAEQAPPAWRSTPDHYRDVRVAGFCQSRAPARQQPGCGLRRTHAGVGHTLPKEAGSAYGGGRQRLAERL